MGEWNKHKDQCWKKKLENNIKNKMSNQRYQDKKALVEAEILKALLKRKGLSHIALTVTGK